MTVGVQISDQVSVGPQPSEDEIRALAKLGFRSIINLRAEEETCRNVTSHQEARFVRELGMRYLHIPLAADHIGISEIEAFRDKFNNVPRPVFVHCCQGRRSAALVLIHEAILQGKSSSETLQRARELGIQWETRHLPEMIERYVERHRRVRL